MNAFSVDTSTEWLSNSQWRERRCKMACHGGVATFSHDLASGKNLLVCLNRLNCEAAWQSWMNGESASKSEVILPAHNLQNWSDHATISPSQTGKTDCGFRQGTPLKPNTAISAIPIFRLNSQWRCSLQNRQEFWRRFAAIPPILSATSGVRRARNGCTSRSFRLREKKRGAAP